MTNFKLIFLFIFLPLFSFSQEKFTISGNVTDQANGETLIGASVYIAGANFGTTTNVYGFYSISVPEGDYSIQFSYIGYDMIEKKIHIDQNTKLNMELSETSTTLGEIVVVAEEKKTNIKAPQMSVTKIKSSQIKKIPAVLGEIDIIKSIQLLPGVANGGEGTSGFNVRGGAADQNLILFDEAMLFGTSHLFGFFSVFNADAVKDIQLYKGGIPAKFGGRISSVLDVRQKDGNKKEYHFNGGIGIISSRLMAEGPIVKDKGSFLLAGRTSYVNMFLKMFKKTKNQRVGFYDLNTKLSYKFSDKDKVFLSGYFGNDLMNFNKLLSLSYGNASGNIRWNHLFSDKLFSNLSYIYSQFNYKLYIPVNKFEWKSHIKNYNLKYDFNYFANEQFKFNFGINAIQYYFNPGEIIPDKESVYKKFTLEQKNAIEGAAYLDIEHNITQKLTARYGLRYSAFFRMGGQKLNKYKNSPVEFIEGVNIYQPAKAIGVDTFAKNKIIKKFGGLEPRLALSYQINENTSIKTSYQRMTQYLHLISNTNSPAPLDVWTPSGKYIDPQKSNQYAVGVFHNFNDNEFSLELEGYYKDIKNRIDYIDGSNIIAQDHIETEILAGEGRAYGAELLLRKNTGKLTGWIAYTLSKSEQQVKGRTKKETGINEGNWYNTPYDRTHDLSITASYEFTNKWTFGANFVFQTGRPTNYPSGKYTFKGSTIPVFVTRNAERLPAYHRMDISATYARHPESKKRFKSEWTFGIYNLYDRKNAASVTFEEDENGDTKAFKTSIFRIMPSITYNFKF